MKSLIGISIGLVSLAVVVTSSSPAIAQLCIPGVLCVDENLRTETTIRTFNVYIRNNSSHPMQATVTSYRKPRDGDTSCLQQVGVGCGDDGWRTKYFNLRPGQKKFILDDVEGRNIYFSAEATDGSGSVWRERKIDMGSTYTRFEYSFR